MSFKKAFLSTFKYVSCVVRVYLYIYLWLYIVIYRFEERRHPKIGWAYNFSWYDMYYILWRSYGVSFYVLSFLVLTFFIFSKLEWMFLCICISFIFFQEMEWILLKDETLMISISISSLMPKTTLYLTEYHWLTLGCILRCV